MSNIYVGLDVHQASITLAVLPAHAPAPTVVRPAMRPSTPRCSGIGRPTVGDRELPGTARAS